MNKATETTTIFMFGKPKFNEAVTWSMLVKMVEVLIKHKKNIKQ